MADRQPSTDKPTTVRRQPSADNRRASPTEMLIVYGADWCEDTQRSLRHLRRLAVPHRYVNIDEDLDALDRAKTLNSGRRRTPVIEMDGTVLVEPTNDTLTAALVEQ